jgi:hypothetical protein
VRADSVPGGGHLLEDCGLVRGMQADREEDRLCNIFWSATAMAPGNNDFAVIITNDLGQRFQTVGKIGRPVK